MKTVVASAVILSSLMASAPAHSEKSAPAPVEDTSLTSLEGAKEVSTEKIAFQTYTEEVSTLPEGTSAVVVKGKEGVRTTYEKTVRLGNKETVVTFTEVTREPRDEVVRVGTNGKTIQALSPKAKEAIDRARAEKEASARRTTATSEDNFSPQREEVPSAGGNERTRAPSSSPSAPAGNSSATGKTPASAQSYARSQMSQYGWGDEDFSALVKLWNRESKWDYRSANPRSSARGIPQAMMSAHFGVNWRNSPRAIAWMNDPVQQIDWGLRYIKGRYGSPTAAWAHSQRTGWY